MTCNSDPYKIFVPRVEVPLLQHVALVQLVSARFPVSFSLSFLLALVDSVVRVIFYRHVALSAKNTKV